MTVYRALHELEKQNLIIRTVGGAMLRPASEYSSKLTDRQLVEADVKHLIGMAASKYINEHETVIFDAGTTVLEVAKAIPNLMQLTVVTNSLLTATILGQYPHVTVMMPSGVYHAETGSLLGPYTNQFIQEIHADTLLLSTAALSIEDGLTNFSMNSVTVKRAMIERVRRVILVADYTKFCRNALITVAPLHRVDILISDDRMPIDLQQRIRQLGIELVLVPSDTHATISYPDPLDHAE